MHDKADSNVSNTPSWRAPASSLQNGQDLLLVAQNRIQLFLILLDHFLIVLDLLLVGQNLL